MRQKMMLKKDINLMEEEMKVMKDTELNQMMSDDSLDAILN